MTANTTIVIPSSSLVYDSAVQGGIDSNGMLNQLWGPDALNNSIVMWLLSFKNEILRSPGRGGYFSQWLFKPMIANNIPKMMKSIQDGIDQDFLPQLTLLAMNITPQYTKRYWEVFMQVFCQSLQMGTTVNANIKNQV